LILFGVAGFAVCLLIILVVSLSSDSATASKFDEALIEDIAPPELGTVTLYTPVNTIHAGQKLTEADFQEVYWPRNSVPDGAIKDLSKIIGSFAANDLSKGEPVKSNHLSNSDGATQSDTLNITQGMRALTIEVNAKRGIEGWALPSTRVDIVLTYLSDGELTSKVVVENAKVLSTGGDSSTANERVGMKKSKVSASSTVTVEVVPRDALKIETAQQMGTLSLHMRAQDDNKSSGVNSFTKNDFESAKNEDGQPTKKAQCKRGKMKISGKEYIVDCDGNLEPAE
jgi:Flp pilus assembly protein CpaB